MIQKKWIDSGQLAICVARTKIEISDFRAKIPSQIKALQVAFQYDDITPSEMFVHRRKS